MAKNIFERNEKKYLLTKKDFEAFIAAAEPHLKADKYLEYTICSVYYDSPDFDLIRRSIDKPTYKEKLRLRSYGIPEDDGTVYIEIKRKFDSTVYKRRYPVSLRLAEDLLNEGGTAPENDLILREICQLRDREELEAKIYIAYDRLAFIDPDSPELRITFDRNIRFRDTDLSLGAGDGGELILDPDECIMEIKTPYAMPLWLCRTLSELSIYPRPFSKVGTAYRIIKNKTQKKQRTTNYAKQPSNIY